MDPNSKFDDKTPQLVWRFNTKEINDELLIVGRYSRSARPLGIDR